MPRARATIAVRRPFGFSSLDQSWTEPTGPVASALEDSGLDGRWLDLELTESVLACDLEATLALFIGLRDLGVGLAIDDFGTGYSSLNYLRRFPLQTLKIDRSFVRDLPHDDDAVALATAIIAMGRSLKLELVAEGVETPQQLEFLRALGCERFQGYLFSPAVPPGEFAALMGHGVSRARLQHGGLAAGGRSRVLTTQDAMGD